MEIMKAKTESALDRLSADMANQRKWLFALAFVAVVTGIALVPALSG